MSELPWYRQVNKDQWKAFWAAYLGWMLDGFDFTIIVLLLPEIQRSFGVNNATAGALVTATLLFRVVGGAGAGDGRRPLGPEAPADFLDPVVLVVRVPQRVLDKLPDPDALPSAVRHRHGWRLGSRHAAGARALAGPPSRAGLGPAPGRLRLGYILSAHRLQFIYPLVRNEGDLGWRIMLWLGILPSLLAVWIAIRRQGEPGLARAPGSDAQRDQGRRRSRWRSLFGRESPAGHGALNSADDVAAVSLQLDLDVLPEAARRDRP